MWTPGRISEEERGAGERPGDREQVSDEEKEEEMGEEGRRGGRTGQRKVERERGVTRGEETEKDEGLMSYCCSADEVHRSTVRGNVCLASRFPHLNFVS